MARALHSALVGGRRTGAGDSREGMQMGSSKRSRSTLPRLPHAVAPGPDETVLKRGGADLQNGWLGRHGDLQLTEDRLVFLPTILDTVLRAKRREISLDDITTIERFPVRVGDPPVAGKRPRMLLHTEACVYELMVGDLDGWIDTLERVYEVRASKGRPHRPETLREGHTNIFLTGEMG